MIKRNELRELVSVLLLKSKLSHQSSKSYSNFNSSTFLIKKIYIFFKQALKNSDEIKHWNK